MHRAFANAFARRAASGLLVALLLAWSATAFAVTEFDTLLSFWPADTAPFSDWEPGESSAHDGEFRLEIRHKTSGEIAFLVWRGRSDAQPAFARSERYNLYYSSGRKDAHTSPELERLLPAWVAWVKRHEGQHTLLPPAEKAEALKAQRLKREEQQSKQALKRQQVEKEKVERWGVGRLVGGADTIRALRSDRLKLYIGLLLLLSLIALLPRVNGIRDALERDDESWFRRVFFWLLPPAAVTYGLLVAVTLEPAVLAGLQPIPSEGLSVFMVDMITRLIQAMGSDVRLLAWVGGTLAAGGTALLVALAAYVLFWNRYAAGYTALFYCIAKLVTEPGLDPWGPLVVDASVAVAIFAMLQQAYNVDNSRRLWLAVAPATLAILFSPAYWVLVPFYFAYMYLEAQDRSRCFRYPPLWAVPLAIAVCSLPGFLLPAISDPGLTLDHLFLGGYYSMFANISITQGSGRLMPDVMLVFLVIGLILHRRRMRKTVLLLAGVYALLLLASVGLANVSPAWVLTGRSLVFPALLAGVGMQALAARLKAARSPWMTMVLIMIVIGFAALEVL